MEADFSLFFAIGVLKSRFFGGWGAVCQLLFPAEKGMFCMSIRNEIAFGFFVFFSRFLRHLFGKCSCLLREVFGKTSGIVRLFPEEMSNQVRPLPKAGAMLWRRGFEA
ncbi:MAG: hypothetical protein EOP54_12750 [Sphingobacteriales bacterium]|nr:MAG: hypothetical protein EOP54_12750 [Sphingobacteriales bacterium]